MESFTRISTGRLFAERYEILYRIGSGGSGEVFAAFDRVAGRRAALKLLFPKGEHGDRMLERVRRELRIVQRLTHPGIVRIHDLGLYDGVLFVVMDLLEGETLASRVQRERALSNSDAVAITRGILDALRSAHEQNVIHRDIKPQNVFLTSRGDPANVVLLDFGLAFRPGDARLTATGGILGTPEYMAPEQARGEDRVGPAADLYSVGIVLWEMLAGQPPFRGDSPLSTLEAHTSVPLPSPRANLPSAPSWLRDLVSWMLEKDPQHRPSSAAAVLGFLDERQRPSRAGRYLRWIRRHLAGSLLTRATLTGVCVIAAVAAIGAAGAFLRLPVEVHLRKNTLASTSPGGHVVHAVEFPLAVADVVPLEPEFWLRREHLALLGYNPELRNSFPRDYPVGLARFDAWTGRTEPFVFASTTKEWENGLWQPFAGYDAVYRGAGLAVTPWKNARGRQILVALYRHQKEHPTKLVFFDSAGWVGAEIDHPGTIRFPSTVIPGARGGEPLMVFTGQNNLLGQRRVLIGVASPSGQGFSSIAMPPGRAAGEGQPAFYSFLPASAMAGGALQMEDENVVFTASDGSRVMFDGSTGLPLDRQQRGGQTAPQWLASRERLLLLLDQAARTNAMTPAAQQAATLVHFAESTSPLDPTLFGVALARAAELYRSVGDTGRALALTQRALAAEPSIPGHQRLLIDLLRREGRWDEARRLTLDADPQALLQPEVLRDLFIAALIENDTETARALLPDVRRQTRIPMTYGRFCKALLHLHEGQPGDALDVLEEDTYRASLPDFAFLRALALASLPTPRPDKAREALAVAEAGKGQGETFPFVQLRAYLARSDGTEGPGEELVTQALARQHRAATSEPIACYFVPWAEALAEGRAHP